MKNKEKKTNSLLKSNTFVLLLVTIIVIFVFSCLITAFCLLPIFGIL